MAIDKSKIPSFSISELFKDGINGTLTIRISKGFYPGNKSVPQLTVNIDRNMNGSVSDVIASSSKTESVVLTYKLDKDKSVVNLVESVTTDISIADIIKE